MPARRQPGGPPRGGYPRAMTGRAALFRQEVIRRRADRLAGDVAIAVPVSWQVIGYLLFAGVAAAVLFLSLASYSRVEIVTGEIVPDAGIAAIMPSRSGVITALAVREGDQVAAGAELALIQSEEASATGMSAGARIETAIAQEDASLGMQIEAVQAAAGAEQSQLAAQRAGLVAEIAQIEAQVILQGDLVDSAQRDLSAARQVAERGYISRRELQGREDAVLSRRQSLSQLTQALAAKRSALAESERQAAQLTARARAQRANLTASRAQIAQQAATVSGTRSYVLRAPVAGRVTALTARVGQPATQEAPLMTIVPDGSVLRAELAVPSAAIGFIKVGQEVRIAVDAFPYQRFGTVNGRVLTVAMSGVRRPAGDAATTTVYPVTVAIERAAIDAYGRQEQLVSGMAVTARVVTGEQSLLQWLFEPLLAIQRR